MPLTYSQVKTLLDEVVGPDAIGAHGAFWRRASRDQFVAKRVFGYPLVTLNDSAGSNLIKALRGEVPFGTDIGTEGATMPRMPALLPPMTAENIASIAEWVDAGCPE